MLPDPERKLLRILINYPSPVHASRMPDFKRLETMTGRRRPDIIRGLEYLEAEGYIIWPDKFTTDGIQIIRTEVLEKSPPKQDNTLKPAGVIPGRLFVRYFNDSCASSCLLNSYKTIL